MGHLTTRVKRNICIGAGALLLAGAGTGFVMQTAGQSTVTDSDGVKVTYSAADHVGTTEEGRKYAPRPSHEFRNQKCDLTPKREAGHDAKNQVAVPGTDLTAPISTTGDMTRLPNAPQAAWFDQSSPLGSTTGHSVIAGHVDYAPGALSEKGGELSPIGKNLHQLQPCTHLYVTGNSGKTEEVVLTSLYRVEQEKIEQTGIYTTTGPRRIDLVTCAGESLEAVGGSNQFHYRYNLVAEGTPVKEAK